MLQWGEAMVKKEVVEFFDKMAADWDSGQSRNEEVISLILENGGIREGKKVLDVACGTGVLFPDYISRGARVTGVDISTEMVRIAKEKYPSLKVICADAESFCFDESFDAIMIYNSFPHFVNPTALFENLIKHLESGGRLTVAHGMSEKALQQCHSGKAQRISQPLPSKERLKEMMSDYLDVDVMISDEEKYIVSGTKK